MLIETYCQESTRFSVAPMRRLSHKYNVRGFRLCLINSKRYVALEIAWADCSPQKSHFEHGNRVKNSIALFRQAYRAYRIQPEARSPFVKIATLTVS